MAKPATKKMAVTHEVLATEESNDAVQTVGQTGEAETAPPGEGPFVTLAHGLSDKDLNAALAAFRHEARVRFNARADARPKVGSQVRILHGKANLIGKIGTAVVVRKTRCFVNIPDEASAAYVLIGDLEVVG